MLPSNSSNPASLPEGTVRVPFTGCDAYFLAIEDMMALAGQGRHVGLSVVELSGRVDAGRLRAAARRFSASHPLLHAKIAPRIPFSAPQWMALPPFSDGAVPVIEHSKGIDLQALCESLLISPEEAYFQIHLLPMPEVTYLVARWFHLLFDGRGAELALAEIARLAANPSEPAKPVASWGIPFPPPKKLSDRLREPRAFIKRHYDLKPFDFTSPGGPNPIPGRPCFQILNFTQTESLAIRHRVERFTGGIFHLPFFFAAATRAHAAVFRHREKEPASYYSPAPVQARKRWMRHPIFQNQVTVLFFKLRANEARDFETAVASLQRQFDRSVRFRVEQSFATMLWWMRRLPTFLYREFLLRDTGGELTSFFQSHTGEFLEGVENICGAPVRNGWHIPTVSQPPGSGIFFNDHKGRLTATIAWREGSLSNPEVHAMVESLRTDLIGQK